MPALADPTHHKIEREIRHVLAVQNDRRPFSIISKRSIHCLIEASDSPVNNISVGFSITLGDCLCTAGNKQQILLRGPAAMELKQTMRRMQWLVTGFRCEKRGCYEQAEWFVSFNTRASHWCAKHTVAQMLDEKFWEIRMDQKALRQ
jgi:hypothetical protein